jgi:chitodextrinase
LVVAALVVLGLGAALVFNMGEPSPDTTIIEDGDTVTGHFDENGISDDYRILLESGDVLTAVLSGDDGTDFDLYIYEIVEGSADGDMLAGNPGPNSTESATAMAWYDDYYIVRVYSYSGAGNYTLSVSISSRNNLDDGNNDFGSAEALALPADVSGQLNLRYDPDDYYEVEMVRGGTLDIYLDVPMNGDFNLYLYDQDEFQIRSSTEANSDEELRFAVTEDGTYYVLVTAWSGSGTYALRISGASVDEDGDGSADGARSLTLGVPVDDWLDDVEDRDDFFSVELVEGARLIATLSGPQDADFDLWVFGPDGESMDEASSLSYGSEEHVDFVAAVSGPYWLDANAYSGGGNYTLLAYLDGMEVLPVASAGRDQTAAQMEIVDFDGSGSWDDSPLNYTWDFGDGALGYGETVTHQYALVGNYTVVLSVMDSDFNQDSDSLVVKVVDPATRPLKYAVVIGVADYQSPSVNDLSYSDDDALSWSEYLEAQGYTVRLLVDAQATEDAINAEISWMESVETSNSTCAFVFSGHGTRDVYTRTSYICAYDYYPSYGGTISDAELADAFSGFETEKIFFFFDSCFSGGFDSVATGGRYVSQTCSEDTWGLDASRYQRGLWTYWFLEWGLKSQGYNDLAQCFQQASVQVRLDPTSDYGYDEWGTYLGKMTPEEEYASATPFYL